MLNVLPYELTALCQMGHRHHQVFHRLHRETVPVAAQAPAGTTRLQLPGAQASVGTLYVSTGIDVAGALGVATPEVLPVPSHTTTYNTLTNTVRELVTFFECTDATVHLAVSHLHHAGLGVLDQHSVLHRWYRARLLHTA